MATPRPGAIPGIMARAIAASMSAARAIPTGAGGAYLAAHPASIAAPAVSIVRRSMADSFCPAKLRPWPNLGLDVLDRRQTDSAVHHLPVPAGRPAADAPEYAVHVALVVEAGGEGDFAQGDSRGRHQLQRPSNAMGLGVLGDGDAIEAAEGARCMGGMRAGFPRSCGDINLGQA